LLRPRHPSSSFSIAEGLEPLDCPSPAAEASAGSVSSQSTWLSTIMRDVRGAMSRTNLDQKKARGRRAEFLTFVSLLLVISLTSGCQAGGDGQSVASDAGSENATSSPAVRAKTES